MVNEATGEDTQDLGAETRKEDFGDANREQRHLDTESPLRKSRTKSARRSTNQSRLEDRLDKDRLQKKTKSIRGKDLNEALLKKLREASAAGDTNRKASKGIPAEIMDDPYTIGLYRKALQDGVELDHSIRINVVGNFSQGKTSLVRRLIGQSNEGVEMTNGIDIDRYHCEHTREGSFVCRKVSSSSGDRDIISRLISIAKTIEAKRKETVNRDDSYSENDEEESVDFSEEIENSEELQSFLREVKSGKMSEEADSMEQLYIWDFAGQYVYYATHAIFHSSKAIYLLVFDLSRNLEDKVKDEEYPTETDDRNIEYFLKFWMNSIHTFVGSSNASLPPVILVGTHKDKLEGDDNAKRQIADAYFEKVRDLVDGTDVQKHIQMDDFAVDNTSPNDIEMTNLRKLILEIGKREEFKARIPAKWIPLENSLNKMRCEKIIALDKLMEIDARNEFPLGDEEQVKLFLEYHHIKGTLVFFDEDPVSKYVVLDPQYLVDAFKCIITSQRFCKNNPEIRPLWKNLTNNARLEIGLVNYQWSQGSDKFIEHRDILLGFLKKLYIISEAMAYDEESSTCRGLDWFVVPSLLKVHSTHSVIDDFLQGKKQTITRLVFCFDNSSVIPTLYHRLLAACLGKWSVIFFKKKHTSMLFENLAVLRLDTYHAGLIEMDLPDKTIELLLVGLCSKVTLGDYFRRFAESLLNHEVRKHRKYTEGYITPYSLLFRCNHAVHSQEKSRLINISDLEVGEEVPCEDFENHTIQVTEAKSEWFLPDGDIESTSIPNSPLSDKELGAISQAIGNNWELLALRLGVTQVQIDHLKQDNDTTVMKIYEMLRLWRQKAGGEASLRALLGACQNVPNLRVDWEEIRNITDEMQKIQITQF